MIAPQATRSARVLATMWDTVSLRWIPCARAIGISVPRLHDLPGQLEQLRAELDPASRRPGAVDVEAQLSLRHDERDHRPGGADFRTVGDGERAAAGHDLE